MVVADLDVRLFGTLDWELAVVFGIGVGCSVLLLADWLGVLAGPSAHTSLLRADEDQATPIGEDSRPIVPK